jgi:hypothetical protein
MAKAHIAFGKARLKKKQHIKFITFIHCILEIDNYMVRKQLLMKGNTCKTNTTIICIFLKSEKLYK